MQQIKCARSLLTCWPPAVQSFSSATSIMYRNNKDWDFKGNPTSLVMNPLQGKPFVQGYNQRKRAYGMRTLACQSMGGEYALDRLKGIIIQPMPILYDGSTNEKVNMDKLAAKDYLFLLISTLNIGPDQVIKPLHPVYKKLQEDERGVIVWIPVDEWTDRNQKTFEDLRTRMPWYTIKCFPSEDMKHWSGKWSFKREPIVWVMNIFGRDVGTPVALRDIQKKGIEAFPILAKKETNTP